MSDYWTICIEEAFETAGITATAEQIASVARDCEGGAEMHSEATGRYHIPDPRDLEIKTLQSRLFTERSKVGCKPCGGTGRLAYNSGPWGVNTQCERCRGEGKVLP